ncbi:MAG: hypothetical protein AB8G11_24750 [Saprospiraceae bacterium]
MQFDNQTSIMGNDRNSKLIGIFLLFALLLNFPIIGIFSENGMLLGIPSLYFYLFLAWALLIVIMYLISNKKNK